MHVFNKIDEWVRQYHEGSLPEEDRMKMTEWIETSPENRKEFERMLRVWLRMSAAGKWHEVDGVQKYLWMRMRPLLKNRRKRLYVWSARAAAIVIILIGCVLAWNRMIVSEEEIVEHVLATESGSPKALLVLNTGKQIELKDGETREKVKIAGVKIVQDSAGGVRFEDSGSADTREAGYNTIMIPEKGEYFAVLSDGTKVWMNSGSKLMFPTRFQGNSREVTLQGEAYFEVTTNAEKPFYVHTGEARIRVLGTAFNVMAYKEDACIEVALLRGKVSFDVEDRKFVLEPGEIASLNRESGNTTVRKGNVAAIVDWTTGRFNFEDITLPELVVKLERWYGVKFVFEDEISKSLRFSGAVTKYRSLNYVLDIITKTTSVRFKESGGSILIYSE